MWPKRQAEVRFEVDGIEYVHPALQFHSDIGVGTIRPMFEVIDDLDCHDLICGCTGILPHWGLMNIGQPMVVSFRES